MALDWPFENRDGFLYIDGVSSIKLAQEYGTPLYVYSENKIRNNIKNLKDAFQNQYKKTRFLYASKANTNLAILNVIRSEGMEIDSVSPGEVFLALKAGFKPNQIFFTGTSVRKDELQYLLEKGVRMNIDSISQIKEVLKIKAPEQISVRINPEIGAGHHRHVITAGPNVKFGVWEQNAIKAYKIALEGGIKRFGIHMHIGSGIIEVEHFLNAVKRLLEIAKKVHESIGISFEFLDVGGGIGVPYRPEEKKINLEVFAERFLGFIKEKLGEYGLGKPEIWIEPGRFIVAESGVLLTQVTTLKNVLGKMFLGVDAGFNTLIRPAMYGSYHHILAASCLNQNPERYDVYGPICESGDILAKDRLIPKVSAGDVLAIMNTGAYGYAMSSQYNSRPRAAEVMVKERQHNLIRKREILQDLLKGQII